MTNKKLFAAISAFNAVVINTPEADEVNYTEDDSTDYDTYDGALSEVVGSIDKLMKILLKGAYFAVVQSSECITPTIFATEKERDEFSTRLVGEVPDIVCKSIDYNTFLEYAHGEEFTPMCYAFDNEENAILFHP